MLLPSVKNRTQRSAATRQPRVADLRQQLGPGQMAFKTRFIGRMEKRLPIAIVVRLAHERDQTADGAELTYTDNVSAHGARVISDHPWKTGDTATVTSLKDEVAIRGKVVYCQKRQEGRYYVGLNFLDRGVVWSVYRTYAKS